MTGELQEFMKKLVGSFFAAALALSAHASGLDSLEQFVKSAKSGRAEFTQVVTSPPRDGQTVRSKTSSGTFEFARPNRFRFNYKKPFEQIIVADGQTLWLYDADLKQVTTRKQSDALGATPAALIASAATWARYARPSTWKPPPPRTASNGRRPRPGPKRGNCIW